MKNDADLTISALAPRLRKKKISPVELTRFVLDRISQLQHEINAYITVVPEIALAQARRAEREIVKGRYRGALHGIPINLKDLFLTKGIRTTAGSGVLQKFIPDRNAAVVDRLLDAGCILLGKTNMHEFAFGSTNVHSYFGPVRNPWDITRMSGGSSGGSAASLVTGQAIASFGTDTGGSIRIPAAACGCVGFKPSYGRISLEGVIPLAQTLDHAGPLARCVIDAALLYDTFARLTMWDQGSAGVLREVRRGIRSFTVGVPRQYFFDRIHPEVRVRVIEAIQILHQLGAHIREVNLQGMEETARIAAEITGCEALAFHEKGLRKKARRYGDDVRSRLEQTRGLSATAYIQSMQRRLIYRLEFDRALEKLDLIAVPTLPVPAPRIDEKEVKMGRWREDVRLAMLRLTRPGNLSGLPAISIPCGFTKDHLPVGLQLIGRRYDELSVLRAAYAYEQATPWHTLFPENG